MYVKKLTAASSKFLKEDRIYKGEFIDRELYVMFETFPKSSFFTYYYYYFFIKSGTFIFEMEILNSFP